MEMRLPGGGSILDTLFETSSTPVGPPTGDVIVVGPTVDQLQQALAWLRAGLQDAPEPKTGFLKRFSEG